MSDMANAAEAATLAVKFDKMGDVDKAVECYRTAARLLDKASASVPPDQQAAIRDKAQEYLQRATSLEAQREAAGPEPGAVVCQQARFLTQQALAADEAARPDLALTLYTRAVDLALAFKTNNAEAKAKINALAAQALDRAEEIKGLQKLGSLSIAESNEPAASPSAGRAQLQRENSVQLTVSGGAARYSQREKEVLRATSTINRNCFLPWTEADLAERFRFAEPFRDEAGPLPLAPRQRAQLRRWARPRELCADPVVVAGDRVDCFSIKQTVVSDCSLVASLAVGALHEARFGSRLVSGILYPRHRARPVYNPFGKYMVKLHLNGVRRKVIIDDSLPLGAGGEFLCSWSGRGGELWVALLEKAYMKVMGGYDFPGSNSNIDLHALTGWIPERRALAAAAGDTFAELAAAHRAGRVLATAATGALPPHDERRTGLVPAHAYAVLDAREEQGVQLLKLKNPWSHLRWRGNYSELDATHWTPALKSALEYDPQDAQHDDNGVFWIDYKSVLRFFDVLYLNWTPRLFQYTACVHASWAAGVGPARDAYNVGDNPQFVVRARGGVGGGAAGGGAAGGAGGGAGGGAAGGGAAGGAGGGALWLLLTRHITSIEDFRHNREYITLLLYHNGGQRVFYPYDPPPHHEGVRINSPHYLVKTNVPPAPAALTLVVAQFEKTTTIYYTLRAYSSTPIDLAEIPQLPHLYTLHGAWERETAGGCENHPLTYGRNPRVEFSTAGGPGLTRVELQLKGPRQLQLGVAVRVLRLDDPGLTAPFLEHSSGPYRSGFVVVVPPPLPAGRYSATLATFSPGQLAPYILQLRADRPLVCRHAD